MGEEQFRQQAELKKEGKARGLRLYTYLEKVSRESFLTILVALSPSLTNLQLYNKETNSVFQLIKSELNFTILLQMLN